MRNLILFTIGLTFLFQATTNAQAYQIKINIDNLSDSTVYFGYYFGDKQYVHDTVKLDKKGKALLKGTEPLKYGMYFIYLPDKSFFEVVVDKDQEFSIHTKFTGSSTDLLKNLKCEGNTDYQIYIDYQNFMIARNTVAIRLRDKLKTAPQPEQKTIRDSLDLLHQQVKDNWEQIEKEYPSSLLTQILIINREVDIPEPPRNEKGEITDSSFQYRFYKAHYFDNVNFADERLLRTSFYYPKIDRYFEKMILPAPDTVIKESAYVLEKAKANDEIFKYTLQLIFNKYNSSNIMGMDKAFVFLAETYYLNGNAPWADSAWLVKVKKRVDEIKPNLVGNVAPELKLITNTDQYISLHHLKADYIVLFFFEPGCGHCKKATPKMKELSDKYFEKGVEVVGIYTQADREEWEKFIVEQHLENWINAWDPYNQSKFRNYYDVQSTPSVYLLNKDKRIIGKRVDVETLEKILEDEFKEKSTPVKAP